MKLHKILFYLFLLALPLQTRILWNSDYSYVSWYFDYHLAMFLYFTDILLIACFGLWLILDRPKYSDLRQNRLFLAILAFLLVVGISLFHVKRIDLGWYQWLKWLEFFLIVTYIRFNFRDLLNFKLAMTLLYIVAVFQALLGWVQFHMQHMVGLKLLGEYIPAMGVAGLATINTTTGKVIRAYGTMPHPNVLGAFLVFGLIAGIYLISERGHREQGIGYRMFAPIGICIILIGIFTTFSRIAWVATALAIISFVSYYLYIKKKTLAVNILLSVAAAGLIIFSLYSDKLQARVSDKNPMSLEDRYFFNQLGWGIADQHPILGVGVGQYVVAMQDLYQLEPWQHQPAHNIFIFLLAELGILGTGLFIFILYQIFAGLKKVSRDSLSLSLTLVGILFLLMGQFDHYFVTIQQGRLMFAVVLGLIAALPNLQEIPNDK